MNDFAAIGKAANLVEKVKGLIDAVNRRTRAECERVVEATASGSFDLSADEVMVLRTIRALGGRVTLKQLVNTLAATKGEGVHSSTVSTTMTRFKKNHLIQEEDNENDRRQPFNQFTPTGDQLARRLDEVDAMVLRNVIGCLQLDDALAADLTQRVGRASQRILEQLQQLQQQSKPSIAGVYDYVLGGTWNTVVDRMFVEGNNIPPQRRQSARANRAFLQRAVHFLAVEKGITQFIDIGSGFPTNRNTHQVAFDLKLNAPPHVTYVDNDPEVVRASRILLSDAKDDRVAENVRVAQEDLRFVKTWLAPDRFQNIDLKKPVAVLLVAVLHFMTDDSELGDILQFLKQRLAPGSYLAISHAAPGEVNKDSQQALVASYRSQVSDVKLRTREELKELLQGFELQDPGLVFISDWKPDIRNMLSKDEYISPENCSLLACVAKA
jgi:DNA-binding MarR family transcriptional regulator